MPRKKFERSTEYPFHISARCINKEWFAIPLEEVWTIMENYLFFIAHAYGIEIYQFVLMNNHFHLVVRDPLGVLSEAMNYFMRETSRAIARRAGRINQIYGTRYFRSLIKSIHYYHHAYKYVYRNPVEAGICKNPEEYEFSTLSRLTGRMPLYFPVVEDVTLFDSFHETLSWLKEKPSEKNRLAVQRALKRGVFELPKTSDGKISPLEFHRY